MEKSRFMTCLTAISILLVCCVPLSVQGKETCFPTFGSDLRLHIPVLKINSEIYSADLIYRDHGPADGIWFEVVSVEKAVDSGCSNPPALLAAREQFIVNFPLLNIADQPYWAGMKLISSQGHAWLKVMNYGPLPKRVFVTSVKGTGDLSSWPDARGGTGIEAGDAICSARADAAGLSGTFIAWLSDTDNDAYCRIHGLSGKKENNCGLAALPEDAGPWVRTDGFPFASDTAHLFKDGTVFSTGSTDEFGRNPKSGLYYFTGTRADGTLYKKKEPPCDNWTNASDVFTAGSNSSFGGFSWSSGASYKCNAQYALLCMEQGHGPAISDVTICGKKVFLTSVKGTGNLSSWEGADGNTGIAAGDSICRTLAANAGLENAEHFKAWLSDSHTSALDRISSDGPWVRVDGIPVAENRQGLEERDLLTVLNLTEKGQYINEFYAWTGTLNNGMTDTDRTCNDWQTGSGDSQGRIGRIFDRDAWTSSGYPACSSVYRLYCFED